MPMARSATTSSSTLRYISWNITVKPAQFAGDCRRGLVFHLAEQGDDLVAEWGHARAAAALTADGGQHHGLLKIPVQGLHELPRSTVRHAHRSRRGRDRAG